MKLKEIILATIIGLTPAQSIARPGDGIDIGNRRVYKANYARTFNIRTREGSVASLFKSQEGEWHFGYIISQQQPGRYIPGRLIAVPNHKGGNHSTTIRDKIMIRTDEGKEKWIDGTGRVTPAERQETIIRKGRIVRERYSSPSQQSNPQQPITYSQPVQQPIIHHTTINHVVQPTPQQTQTPVQRQISEPSVLETRIDQWRGAAYDAYADEDYNTALTNLLRIIRVQGENVDFSIYDKLESWFNEGKSLSSLNKDLISRVEGYILGRKNLSSNINMFPDADSFRDVDIVYFGIKNKNDSIVANSINGKIENLRLKPGEYKFFYEIRTSIIFRGSSDFSISGGKDYSIEWCTYGGNVLGVGFKIISED